jgi:Cd2+/Zn2+-exporting ATPase
VAAIARAARFGVLVKGGIHLEDLGKVKAVAFDKTGTLTKGRIVVNAVVPKAETVLAEDVLAMAASVEARSEHPLARAIVAEAERSGVRFEVGEHFVSIRGKGAKARVGGRNVHVGNPRLFTDLEVELPEDMALAAAAMRERGETAVFVGTGQEILGVIGLSDEVRTESASALSTLKELGVKTTMLTGDEEATAKAVASKTGIGSYRAGLLPGDKKEVISAMKEEHGTVAMVGDGVNDAPSLAAADVGIAMGAGADVALETADIALLKDDLCRIPWALRLGRFARSLIVQNMAFSLLVKAAALGLVMAGLLPLWLAVLVDSGAAVLVTLNGLRILRYAWNYC